MTRYQVQYLHDDGTWHIWLTCTLKDEAQETARDLVETKQPCFTKERLRIIPIHMKACASCSD